LTGDQARLAYATSALVVRRLLDEVGGPAIAALLRELAEGVDFDTAFERHARQSWRSLQGSLTVP
jgi:hypothetical protein